MLKKRRAQLHQRLEFVSSFLCLGIACQLLISFPAFARDHWTELNIGPFYVDYQGDADAARDDLDQLEQLRWVLGGLLESKDLPSLWPIRVMLSDQFVSQNRVPGEFVWQNGQYLLVIAPRQRIPLGQVAGILLDANTPRLPASVESGLRQLFDTLEAHGSRVTWGGRPPKPDLAWARMQLFATKFEYGASFHIFMTALKSGSGDMRVAERNAFNKDPEALESEAKANLAKGDWQPVAVSGRPLNPKKDFGEHSLDTALAGIYLGYAQIKTNPDAAETTFRSAVQERGTLAPLGYEGLAEVAKQKKQDPRPFLDRAIHAGSKSAPVYVEAAEGLPADDAIPLLKKAAQLNPRWGEPLFREAQLISNSAQQEELLSKAVQLSPRATKYWIALAQAQTKNGHSTAAQGSWLRAEDSAPSEADRDHVQKLANSSEQQRLDAAEAERRRQREAVHLDDEKAQEAENARIRAAEEKANQQLDQLENGSKPQNVIPWAEAVPKKKLSGTLVRVDCLHSSARLWVKSGGHSPMALFLKDPSKFSLSCGVQASPPRVSIVYAASPDDRFQTSGTVVNLKLQ